MAYEPIRFARLVQGSGMPPMVRAPEGASKTFAQGVPVVLSSGNVQEAAFGGSEVVYGFSMEPAHNLSVAGTEEQGYSEATPVNQTGRTIPVGAWMKDGKCQVVLATGNTVFRAKLLVGQVFTQALVSTTRYALKKDTTYWYIDNTDSGTNDEHAAQIVGVDPASPNSVTDAAVLFIVPEAARVTE